MSDDTIAPQGDVAIDNTPAPASDNTPLSPHEAASMLTQRRWKQEAEVERKLKAEAPQKAAEPEPTPPPEDAAAPAEEATSEQEATQATDEPAEIQPPIEAPRSWSKEWKEEFKSYPRELQEKIAAREQDRETTLRRGQNELAEQRKAIETERSQVEQARLQYENALPQLLQTLHQQQQGEFSDIKTMADVENLARTDWPRYALWDAQQKKIAAVSQEMKAAQDRQSQEQQSKWSSYATKQDAAFIERAPEMADPEKATKIAKASYDMLKDVGYQESELANLWNGNETFRDYRMQLILRDAARYRDAQKSAPAKQSKPVPPVQRPGTSQPKASTDDARIKALESKLEKSGDMKDAVALMLAKRNAR